MHDINLQGIVARLFATKYPHSATSVSEGYRKFPKKEIALKKLPYFYIRKTDFVLNIHSVPNASS